MRNKKLLSTVVASALVATTMAVPVMAADGGEVDVDVSTRTAVIRVEVPTSLEVAVNQFEKGDGGSQIYSAKFGMENKSEIPVKVTVDSTATLAESNPITLVSTKAAAEASEDAEAWLAVAAEVEDGKFVEDDSEGNAQTIGELTEASENVATFVQGADTAASSGAAQQIFYLSADDSPTVTYTKFAPVDAAAVKTAPSYAQIYAVTELTLTTSSEQDDLDAAIGTGNVYKEDSSGTVTRIDKGTSETYAAGNKYYSEGALTERKDVAPSSIYMYAEATASGKAGFRYLGRLSGGKETWTADDIKKVKIAYDIKGVTKTKYDEVADNCIYGLYNASVVPESDGTTPIAITYTGAKPTAITIVPVTITGSNKASFNLPEGGGNLTITDSTITLSASYISMLKGAATRGIGTYKFTVNGTDYTFVIK